MRGLILFLLLLPPVSHADIFKYVDSSGTTHFTDAPLNGKSFRLKWKRPAKKVIDENRAKLVAMGRSVRAASRLSPKSTSRSKSRSKSKPVSFSKRRARYDRDIDRIARQNGLDPDLLHAVIRTESAYNPSAVSSAGATGLMQLMPGTAKRYGVKDIWDPLDNLQGGARYLRDLLDMFDNDQRLALAGYNAGENAVKKYGNRIPPYPETQRYVRKVLQFVWAERASAGS